MKKRAPLLLAFFISACFQLSAQNYQARLLKDVVKIVGKKMTFNHYTMIALSNGNKIQVKTYSEAPSSGVISRDNFVAFSSIVSDHIIVELSKEDRDARSHELEDVIGKPDVTVNIYMAKAGIQIETITMAGVDKSTMQWADILE